MDPDGAGAAQQLPSHGQGHRDGLLLRGSRRPGVLQVQGGGQPRLVHQSQEGVKISLLQSLSLLLRPAVLLKEVHGPEHRPVAALLPQLRQGGPEGPLVHIPQELLAEVGGHRPHLPGDVRIVISKIRVAGAGVHDAQGVARPGEVVLHLLHHGGSRVGKIDGHRAAHRGAHLVHQSAGLAEVDVLRVLAHLGPLHRIQGPAAEEAVHDGGHQDLIGGGGGQAGAGQHRGGHIGVKACRTASQLHQPGRHSPHQRGGAVLLLLPDLQIPQVHLQGGVALRPDPDQVRPVGGGAGQHIQIHTAAQHTAVLVVGVVAADLRPARSAEQSGLGPRSELRLKGSDHPDRPLPSLFQGGVASIQSIQPPKRLISPAFLQLL